MDAGEKHRPDIMLSGRAFTKEQLEDGDIDLQAGDLKLYHGLDGAGRKALQRRHTNYGFSGTIRASIWDGRGWRRMRLISLLGEAVRYPTQGEKDEAYARVRQTVPSLAGLAVFWDGSRYARKDAPD